MLWVLGGRKPTSNQRFDTTLLYDGTSWSDGPDMPLEHFKFFAVAVDEGKVFIFGNNVYETYMYDFAVAQWDQKADIPAFRRDVATDHIKLNNL